MPPSEFHDDYRLRLLSQILRKTFTGSSPDIAEPVEVGAEYLTFEPDALLVRQGEAGTMCISSSWAAYRLRL
jgi:hypothetical protein